MATHALSDFVSIAGVSPEVALAMVKNDTWLKENAGDAGVRRFVDFNVMSMKHDPVTSAVLSAKRRDYAYKLRSPHSSLAVVSRGFFKVPPAVNEQYVEIVKEKTWGDVSLDHRLTEAEMATVTFSVLGNKKILEKGATLKPLHTALGDETFRVYAGVLGWWAYICCNGTWKTDEDPLTVQMLALVCRSMEVSQAPADWFQDFIKMVCDSNLADGHEDAGALRLLSLYYDAYALIESSMESFFPDAVIRARVKGGMERDRDVIHQAISA